MAGAGGPMDLELHQLERRYEELRTRSAKRERRLLASIAESGQHTPIIVVRDAERFVIVDGYKRVRVMARLGHDTVSAVEWTLGEADALLLERMMRGGESDSALEQAWFLRELVDRFGLELGELARRFDRSKSWVSRRLALVSELPEAVQRHVRSGAIGGHAAMKYLVPLARANAEDCERLAEAVAPEHPTSRQMAALYTAYWNGNAAARRLVVDNPALVLRASDAAQQDGPGATPIEHLLEDFRIVSSVARRARTRLGRGALDGALSEERQQVREGLGEAHDAVERLKQRCDRELVHGMEKADVGSDDTHGDSATA